jgi:RNA polymerase primary sigma factor
MASNMYGETPNGAAILPRRVAPGSTTTRYQGDELHQFPSGEANVGTKDASGTEARDLDSLTTYLHEISRVPRLTPSEELELGERIAAGDEQALQRMVEANLRLVIAVAKHYHHGGIALHDLVQEGNIGLLRAAQRFDYRTGNRFSTYAVWWIRQAVNRALASQAYAIRVPFHVHEGIGQAERDLAVAAASDEGEVAEKLPVSAETVESARRARQTVSLDRVHGDEGDAPLADTLADTDSPSPFDAAANQALREQLMGLLEGLNAREHAVVSLLYGLADGHPHTCAEVGIHLHLTRERVRQIEELALNKLRNGPGGTALESFLP